MGDAGVEECGARFVVRESAAEDIGALTEIYGYYVLHSTSTFELTPPDFEEMERRRAAVIEHGLPHLVIEGDGEIAGFAYASTYRARPGYRFTVEDSIYLHPEFAGKGLGKMLLAALIQACERGPWRQMVAIIGGSDNLASIRLHAGFSFREAGVLQSVGYKFGRWVDTVLMQRAIGAGDLRAAE